MPLGWDDVGDILGRTASGALTGSKIPGIGTIVGGTVGLLSGVVGALTEEDEPEQYRSPYEGIVAGQIAELRDDSPSAEFQANRADATRTYNRQIESLRNNPGIGGNAAVLAKTEELAGQSLGANLQRSQAVESERISNNKKEAARLALQQEQLDINNQQFNEAQNGPSLGESLLGSALSLGVGVALGDTEDTDDEDTVQVEGVDVDVIRNNVAALDLGTPSPETPMPDFNAAPQFPADWQYRPDLQATPIYEGHGLGVPSFWDPGQLARRSLLLQ